MRTILAATVLLALAVPASAPASAQPRDPIGHPVRIGVITDMSGSLSAQSGPGAVLAAQMAAEDCLAAECAGMTVEVLSADHQNKADVAIGIVRDWWDNKGVTAVADIIQATVQIAVQHEAAARNQVALFTGGTARLTSEDCAPRTSVMWMWDSWNSAAGATRPLAKPGSKWFYITADYVFGKSLQADSAALVQQSGGQVVGAVSHPFAYGGDFSPFVVQAQSSGATVLAMANSGSDLITTLKQAREFGVGSGDGRALVGLSLSLQDVVAIGPEVGQGVLVNEAFYWDLDDKTRAWSARFAARNGGKMPSTIQAGDYTTIRAYLRAVVVARSTDTKAVIDKLHELPVDDLLTRNGTLRPDGRMVHDTYLFRIKGPGQGKSLYDVYEKVATIPAAEAFRPQADGKCTDLWKP